MRKQIVLTIMCVLPLGFVAGGLASHAWLAWRPGADPARATGAEPAREGSKTEHVGEDTEHSEHSEGHVKLSEEAIRQFGVQIVEASGGRLEETLKLPAEIVLNADSVAHIVPRAAGIVLEVRTNVGDKVETGEVMAVLESRELAEARAADLAAEARLRLAENNFKRVEKLVRDKITPEKEYHEAQQQLEEARIQHRETEARLQAVGILHEQVASVPDGKGSSFSRYEIKAPFPATVVDKHITRGEVHDSNSDVFVLADLSTVWVDISVYPQDAGVVQPGATVRVSAATTGGSTHDVEGKLFYVSPIIREATRTGLARAAINNEAGFWRPGMFVTAEITVGEDEAAVLVDSEAIQTMGGQSVVFVEDKPGCFEKRPVHPGRVNGASAEIRSGLKPGERYVSKGAFILKAELSKGAGGHEH